MCLLCYLNGDSALVDRSKYRFYPVDFEAGPNKPMHIDLCIDHTEERTVVESVLTLENVSSEPVTTISLDSNNLKVHSVKVLVNKDNSSFTRLNSSDLADNNWNSHCEKVAVLDLIDLPDHTTTAEKSDDPIALGLKPSTTAGFVTNLDGNNLHITFPSPILPGEQFVIKTLTTAVPDDVMLEGAYKDFHYKPELPQNIMTQCQQFGFQRIAPSIDHMIAKIMFRTKIIADARFNTIVSGVNLSEGYYKEEVKGKRTPTPHPVSISDFKFAEVASAPSFDRVALQYEITDVPMATYLFMFTVGFYETYSRVFEYPDGDCVEMQLLLHPGQSNVIDAAKKLDLLHEVFLHAYISLGPERTQHTEERKRIYSLVKEREELKKKAGRIVTGYTQSFNGQNLCTETPIDCEGVIIFDEAAEEHVGRANGALTADEEARLQAVREELDSLQQLWTTKGHKYIDSVYREISMLLSFFGGMENRANTTIVKNSICTNESSCDNTFFYCAAVSAHEHWHDINGSSVTGASPFEIYLNEAATVQIGERLFLDHVFGDVFCRMRQASAAHMPVAGPLAMDSAATARAVVPPAYNNSHELIDATTYSKAPAVLDMIRTIMGEAEYYKAFWQYYAKYRNSNATTAQWLECFEDVAGRKFDKFADGWLRRPGFPTLHYSTSYTDGSYTVDLKQTGFEDRGDGSPWEFPVPYAVFKGDLVLAEGMTVMTEATASLTLSLSEQPDFISVGRNYAFFGKIVCHDDDHVENPFVESAGAHQVLHDTDAVNRMLAYRSLAEVQKVRIVKAIVAGETPVVDDDFITLTRNILFDDSVELSHKSLILGYLASVEDPELATQWWAIHDARVLINTALLAKYHTELTSLLHSLNTDEMMAGEQVTHIHHRALKSYLLTVFYDAYCVDFPNKPEIKPQLDLASFCVDLFRKTSFMTDRLASAGVIVGMATTEDLADVPALQDAFYTTDAINALCSSTSVQTLIDNDVLTYYPEYPRYSSSAPSISRASKARFISAMQDHLLSSDNGMGNYFALCGSSLNGIKSIFQTPQFKINRPDHARTAARQFAAARKVALLSHEGIAMTEKILFDISSVNEMSASALTQMCGTAKDLKGDARLNVKKMLENVLPKVTDLKKISTVGAIKTLLNSLI